MVYREELCISHSLEGYDFVIFLDTEWEATTQRNRQHFLIDELARQLEGYSKILGVERPLCTLTSFFTEVMSEILDDMYVNTWEELYHSL